MDLIQKAKLFVEELSRHESSGHDYYHALRVYNLALTIADAEAESGRDSNREIVALAALLHDVDDVKVVGPDATPFANAEKFLKDNSYPDQGIAQIKEIIENIGWDAGVDHPEQTFEGKIVQDADRLDAIGAIGAIGIARTFTFGGAHGRLIHDPSQKPRENMTLEQYHSEFPSTLNHFYEKLLKLKNLMNTESAKKLAAHRHAYLEEFVEEFLKEWDGKL